jgi:hypothetical protein
MVAMRVVSLRNYSSGFMMSHDNMLALEVEAREMPVLVGL